MHRSNVYLDFPCGILVNSQGERFMLKYDPHAELAPRDIVARSIANEILKSDQEYVYLDCRTINKKDFINQFPTILKNCKKKFDIIFLPYFFEVPMLSG